MNDVGSRIWELLEAADTGRDDRRHAVARVRRHRRACDGRCRRVPEHVEGARLDRVPGGDRLGPMDKLNYGSFSASFQGRHRPDARLPLSGSIEVDAALPAHLPPLLQQPADGATARRAAASSIYDEHCRLLDELADAGCLWLLYTGGEIFARRDFLDIYTYAKKKGFLITLFTNGTLITERIADHLVAWRPFAIEITLYGLTTARPTSGSPASRDRSTKCMRGIASLLERGLPLSAQDRRGLAPTGTRSTRCSASPKTSSASRSSSTPMINPRLDCSQSPLDVRLSPEECGGARPRRTRSGATSGSSSRTRSARRSSAAGRRRCISAAAASARSAIDAVRAVEHLRPVGGAQATTSAPRHVSGTAGTGSCSSSDSRK